MDDSLTIRTQAYEYIAVIGHASALRFLEGLRDDAENGEFVSALDSARFKLLSRLDPEKAVSEIINKAGDVSENEIRTIQRSFLTVDENLILQALESPSEKIRKLSAEELTRRGKLSAPVATKLTNDSSVFLRALAFQALAKTGKLPDFDEVRGSLSQERSSSLASGLSVLAGLSPPEVSPDADSVIVSFYRTRSYEELFQAINWFTRNGSLAYRALGLDRYEQFSATLHSDLENRFSRIKQESTERVKEKANSSAEMWQSYAAELEKFDELMVPRFRESAFLALEAHGDTSDANLVRPYISDSDSSIRDAAVAALCRLGNADDVPALMKAVTDTWGATRRKATAAVLRLSPDCI